LRWLDISSVDIEPADRTTQREDTADLHPPLVRPRSCIDTSLTQPTISIHDADSLLLLLRDVHAVYCGLSSVRRPQLTEALATVLPCDPTPAVEFWTSRLAPFADADFPSVPELTASRPPVGGFISHKLIMSESPAEGARSLACSLSDIVQAAWAIVLCAYMETNSVVLGQTLSDRSAAPRLGSTIGPLVSVVPIPVSLNSTTTGRSLVKDLAQRQQSSFTHRHIRLGQVRQILQRPAHQLLFPAMFVVHVEPEVTQDYQSSVRLWGDSEIFGVHVEHSLALNVEVRKGGRVYLDLWGNSHVMYVHEQYDQRPTFHLSPFV
jgi:ferricrocin synthase